MLKKAKLTKMNQQTQNTEDNSLSQAGLSLLNLKVTVCQSILDNINEYSVPILVIFCNLRDILCCFQTIISEASYWKLKTTVVKLLKY